MSSAKIDERLTITNTTLTDFAILKNGVDERIEFIKHIETGFYNITKARNMVQELKKSEAGNILPASKETRKWFLNSATQELIEEVKRQTGRKTLKYDLKSGTPVQFHGTYIHELLVDHFLVWLDPKYGVKVSVILRELHEKANRKIIEEKNCKIEELSKKIDDQTQLMKLQAKESRKETEELKEMLRRQGVVLDEVKIQNDGLKEQNDVLIDKVDKLGEEFQVMANILSQVAISSNVICNIMKRTHNDDIMNIDARSPSKGIQTLKMLILFACYDDERLIVRFACCNFTTCTNVLKDAIKFMENKFKYLTTSAIALSGDIEVNLEHSMIKKVFNRFEGKTIVDANGKKRDNLQKWRSFKLQRDEKVQDRFYQILYALRHAFTMHHQSSLIKYINEEDAPGILKQKAASIYKYCNTFANDATIHCQQYIDSIISKKEDGTVQLVQVSTLPKTYTDNRVLNKQLKPINMHIAEYSKTLLKLRIREFNLQEYINSLNIKKEESSDDPSPHIPCDTFSDTESLADGTVIDY